MADEPKQQEAPRAKFDIYKIDYDWIEKTTSKKDLRLAHETLVEDNGYPDLLKTLENRLMEVDPTFKKKMEANVKLDYEQQRVIDKDIFDFIDDINKTDN